MQRSGEVMMMKVPYQRESKMRRSRVRMLPVLSVLGLLAGVLMGIVGTTILRGEKKIGVVRTLDLVEKYKGMEEARREFEGKRGEWLRELDTLQGDYQKKVEGLNREWEHLSSGERGGRQEEIRKEEERLGRFREEIEREGRAEEGRLQGEVLKQVNVVVKEYADREGYDVIFGATGEGSILQSKAELDITDELIEVLNQSYTSRLSDGRNGQ